MSHAGVEIRWLSGESEGTSDFIPMDWFLNEGVQRDLEHLLTGGYAQCDASISRAQAILTYDNNTTNRDNDVILGRMRLNFSSSARLIPISIDWAYPGKEWERADVEIIKCLKKSVVRNITERQWQPKFRNELLNAYEYECPITGCTDVAALEAAHIDVYDGVSTQRRANGILMRADIHSLFDAGLLWIDDNYNVKVSDEVSTPAYREFDETPLRLPPEKSFAPDKSALARHRDRFRRK